jgi:hypothetical protein
MAKQLGRDVTAAETAQIAVANKVSDTTKTTPVNT